MSHDVDFGGSLQHGCLVGTAITIKSEYVARDACCSYFTKGILVGKGSELCYNISTENWCQYPFKRYMERVILGDSNEMTLPYMKDWIFTLLLTTAH